MNQFEAAQALCRIARSGQDPGPEQMRALQSPYLDRLADEQLMALGRLLASRLRSPGVKALVGDITPHTVVTMVSDPDACEELLSMAHHQQRVVHTAWQAVAQKLVLSCLSMWTTALP
jgi:hypothetical protein